MREHYKSPVSIRFWHDWDSFIFWGKHQINWRNFTLIEIAFETNCYSNYLEINIGILGFHFEFEWCRKMDDLDFD